MMQVTTKIALTDREEAFVLNLARGQKPTRAAVNAGWSVASARPLLLKPHLAGAIRTIAANMVAVVRTIDQAA